MFNFKLKKWLIVFILCLFIIQCQTSIQLVEGVEVSKNPLGFGEDYQYWDHKERMRELAREKLTKKYEILKRIHRLKQKPLEWEWLWCFKEKGRSVKDYQKANPIRPGKSYQKIYILLLGSFTAKQQQIIELTRQYIGIYFNIPV